jgi:hypothetical protein
MITDAEFEALERLARKLGILREDVDDAAYRVRVCADVRKNLAFIPKLSVSDSVEVQVERITWLNHIIGCASGDSFVNPGMVTPADDALALYKRPQSFWGLRIGCCFFEFFVSEDDVWVTSLMPLKNGIEACVDAHLFWVEEFGDRWDHADLALNFLYPMSFGWSADKCPISFSGWGEEKYYSDEALEVTRGVARRWLATGKVQPQWIDGFTPFQP